MCHPERGLCFRDQRKQQPQSRSLLPPVSLRSKENSPLRITLDRINVPDASGIPVMPTRYSVFATRYALPSYPTSRLQKFANFFKKFLHLWKFPVISHLRTNFAKMPGKTHEPGSREQNVFPETRKTQGRRGGESESLEEAAIEIGNG